MRIIWQHAPVSTNEIVEKLESTTSWNPKTIQTLIKRLVTKQAVTYVKEGRVFVCTPLVEENEYVSLVNGEQGTDHADSLTAAGITRNILAAKHIYDWSGE